MFFVFPAKWVTASIAAGALAFGPIPGHPGKVTLHYVNLPGNYIAATDPPTRIAVDKRPRHQWPKWLAECVLVHEYAHLTGRHHSRNRRSIMYKRASRTNCLPWLYRHGLG